MTYKLTYELLCPKDGSGILYKPQTIEFVCEQGHELTVQELVIKVLED